MFKQGFFPHNKLLCENMKLVADFTTPSRANKFSRKLKRLGIASFVGISRVGNTFHRLGVGQKTYGVWVLDKSQYEDAYSIAEGKEIEVSFPFTREQISKLEQDATQKSRVKIVCEILIVFVCIDVLVCIGLIVS